MLDGEAFSIQSAYRVSHAFQDTNVTVASHAQLTKLKPCGDFDRHLDGEACSIQSAHGSLTRSKTQMCLLTLALNSLYRTVCRSPLCTNFLSAAEDIQPGIQNIALWVRASEQQQTAHVAISKPSH